MAEAAMDIDTAPDAAMLASLANAGSSSPALSESA
jgi:hypothetical protein